ncbi:MAG: hypothetical protein JSW28_06510 [Thermoplasmata archaeon]|nr:MAG: hypothetical protein JSW28_06510 [Thermoplasmata archaeon]
MMALTEAERALYETIMERISALCKGFLLVADKSMDKACSFCRGLLILLNQLYDILEKTQTVGIQS